MTINRFSSPMHLADDIQEILDSNLEDKRLEKAFLDVKNDLEALHYLIKAIDLWQRGEYSSQTMAAAFNLYKSERGRVSYLD